MAPALMHRLHITEFDNGRHPSVVVVLCVACRKAPHHTEIVCVSHLESWEPEAHIAAVALHTMLDHNTYRHMRAACIVVGMDRYQSSCRASLGA